MTVGYLTNGGIIETGQFVGSSPGIIETVVSAGGFKPYWIQDDEIETMKKNVASQSIGTQMITIGDGSNFTGTVTLEITKDNGTQTGSAGTAPAHEGNGYHSYSPTQAESNADHIAFTFSGSGALSKTVQVYTDFPQTVDNDVKITIIDGIVDDILIDTADMQPKVSKIPLSDGTISWNATALGDINAQADLALTDYDGPTNAEMINRTLLAANYFDFTSDTVQVGTNNDKTGYSISGTLNTLDDLENIAQTDIVTSGAIQTAAGIVVNVGQVGQLLAIANDVITALSIAAGALDGKGDWNIGKTGYSLTQSFPTNFEDMAITVTTGLISVGTNNDKAGYSISGTIQTLDGLENVSTADILASGDIDGLSIEESLKIITASQGGEVSGMATTTVLVKAADGSKVRITATVDADGNRSAVTLDASG